MTDKEYREVVRRIKPVVAKWADCCGLGRWRDIDFVYHRNTESLIEAFNEPHISERDRRVAGRTQVNWEYLEATVHLNVELFRSMSNRDLDYTIRHEICHLLVNEMREWKHGNSNGIGIRHEEHVVSQLAMVLGWTLEAGRTEGRREKTIRRKKR